MLQHMICRLFPSHMDMDQLLPLLMRTESSAHVVSDLSWRLPGIVSAKDFPESLLEPLCERLTECILDGAIWDKTARRKVVPRVHPVAALAQVCSRLLENGERKEHVFRSVAVAFYLRDEYRYRNDAYQNLRAAINKLSGRERESLFWASDALSQIFHPEENAFQRMLAATSEGAITPEPERDSEWIIACLTDKPRPLEDREMLLEVAIRFYAQRHSLFMNIWNTSSPASPIRQPLLLISTRCYNEGMCLILYLPSLNDNLPLMSSNAMIVKHKRWRAGLICGTRSAITRTGHLAGLRRYHNKKNCGMLWKALKVMAGQPGGTVLFWKIILVKRQPIGYGLR